jgi:Flp pilus assembly protein protease CpaA
MIEIIVIALVGTIAAGLWDLKTTEVPDRLPVAMVGIGLLYWFVTGLMTGIYTNFIFSATIGTTLLAIGLLLYKKGQWGGADAWVLAAIGYTIPVYEGSLFIIPYLFNFMIVTVVYTIAYAIVIGFLNRKVFGKLKKDLMTHSRIVITPFVCLAGVLIAYLFTSSRLILPLIGIIGFLSFMVIFWRYALVIENNVFKRKIHVSRLRKGDVLVKDNWVGLTERQVKQLKSRKNYVTIKDGIRFVPVFSIALALTLLYGNLFFMIFG